jgi:hypothetical protein
LNNYPETETTASKEYAKGLGLVLGIPKASPGCWKNLGNFVKNSMDIWAKSRASSNKFRMFSKSQDKDVLQTNNPCADFSAHGLFV